MNFEKLFTLNKMELFLYLIVKEKPDTIMNISNRYNTFFNIKELVVLAKGLLDANICHFDGDGKDAIFTPNF